MRVLEDLPRVREPALLGFALATELIVLGFDDVIGVSSVTLFAIVFAGTVALALWRARTALFAVVAAIGVLIGVIAVTPLAGALARFSIRDEPVQSVDAVIVLNGGTLTDGRLTPESVDRLMAGIDLIRSGAAKRLMTTRTTEQRGATTVSSDADQERFIRLGIGDAAWEVVGPVASTRDEAERARAALGAGKRVAIVTSPMHTRRACATFEGVSLAVTCVAAASRSYSAMAPRTPVDRLAVTRAWLYERAATILYASRGWLRKPEE